VIVKINRSEERLFQSAHSCRVCGYWCEGDFSRLREQAMREMTRGCCDPCWELVQAESPQVGTCGDHQGVHVRDAYVLEETDPPCRRFRRIPLFQHGCSGVGNALGGYDCLCGQPWLDALGGCMAGGLTYEQFEPLLHDARDRRWAQRMAS
jgi:hypothetical protein